MLHETSGKLLRVAALVALTGLAAGPAEAKSKLADEALRTACVTAFGGADHFDWNPRMGISNAVSTCDDALRQFPADLDVQFYHAVARDQWADRGGTQDDNIYATEVYRRLAAEGHQLAQHALGTMFNENSGVSKDEALSYMVRARAGEFGQSIRCEALRTFGLVDLEGTGASYDLAAAEEMARGNYVCAGNLVNMYQNDYITPGQLSRPVDDYARYAAVHGDPWGMTMVGLFYAYGTGSTEVDQRLQGQFTATQDAERAGDWLLLAHWASASAMGPEARQEYWDHTLHLEPVALAVQTALSKLGFYDGSVDGHFLRASQDALAAFEASDMIDTVFQAVRAKEKYDPRLGEREPLHLGTPAISAAPAWTLPLP